MVAGIRKLLGTIAPDIGAAVKRFPIEVLIAAVLTVYVILLDNKVIELDFSLKWRIASGLIAAFLWALAIDLLAQSQSLNKGVQSLLVLIGFIFIGVAFAFPDALSFNRQLFLCALILFVGLSAYLYRGVEMAQFWLFNHKLWLGAALAYIGAILFSSGLSLTIWTLDLLFGLKFLDDYYTEVWIVGLLFIAPVNWLALVPQDFKESVPEGEQKEFTSYAVALIVKFILVPLLLVYTAILYAYAGKIIFEGAVPRGQVGVMVLLYGAAGALTILFAYPTRYATGGSLTRFFWNYWFLLTVGPILLLAVAVYQRIEQYGVTTERYLVVLFGLWLAIMAVFYAIKREQRDLRGMPAVLCVFLLVASFGPWGAKQLAVHSQIYELQELLRQNELFKDGKVIPAKVTETKLSTKDHDRIRSIILYLGREGALERLEPWFSRMKEGSPFPLDNKKSHYLRARDIMTVFAVDPNRSAKFCQQVSFAATKQTYSTDIISGYQYISGPYAFYSYDAKKSKAKTIKLPNIGKFDILVQDAKLVIRSSSEDAQEVVNYSLLDLLKQVHEKYPRKISKDKKKEPIEKDVFLAEKETEHFKVGIIFQNLSGNMKKEKVNRVNLSFWVLISKKETE